MLPPTAEARSTLYMDEREPGFAPMQKLTGFMARLKEMISPSILSTPRGGLTSPLTTGASYMTPHSPVRKSTSLKLHKGDKEVSIFYHDGTNAICVGLVGNNGRVCTVGTTLCGYAHS